MTLSSPQILLGLSKIRNQIKPLLASNVGGRFFLIEGPYGTGRLDIACALAKEWSGKEPLIHEPQSIKTGYTVEQIRLLCQEIQQVGLGSQKIVYVLKNFELMPAVSANAWLKSLEELPSHVWVIAVAIPDQVLPTLLSRALRLKTNLSSSFALREWLKSLGYLFDEKQWGVIDIYAAGSPQRALNYFDEKLQKRLFLVEEFAKSTKWSDAQALARKIEAFASDEETPKMELWREVIAALASYWNVSKSNWINYKEWLKLIQESEEAIERHLKMASILERLWIEKESWIA